MKTSVRLLIVGLIAFIFAGSFQLESSAQKRDRFSHSTAAHKKKDCGSCHTNPTKNWATARGYPDVSDFPSHIACFACHRKDIFSGNQPVFCGSCHVNPGPRGVARFPFPVRSRSHEFSTIFPHNVHQDIIASTDNRKDVAVAHFLNASFTRKPDDKPQFNNCAICHQTRTELPKFTARTPKTSLQPLANLAADSFLPTARFFKDMPLTHASCFTCHYQGIKPAGTNCAGCHKLTAPYSESAVVQRYSLKFDHSEVNDKREMVHTRDCMTCHVRIAQNADLKTLIDADVPFMACASCHGDDLVKELTVRAENKANNQPPFQCNYCHSSAIGRFDTPISHRTP
jgi:hypothetical protein